jgi:hypothetical protein
MVMVMVLLLLLLLMDSANYTQFQFLCRMPNRHCR